jgi:hypothetical protein
MVHDMDFQHFGSAVLLIVGTSIIHGAGTLAISWALFRSRMFAARHFGPAHNASLLTLLILALVAVHLAEIICWASFFSFKGCFADFDTSLYFSMATYTTLGYGDVVLRGKEWRLLGGLEALTGSLMLCWSTVLLVHVVTKMYRQRRELWEEGELAAGGRIRHPERGR